MPELDIPTLQLAKKLASHDNFSPAWIDYPAWAGTLPDTAKLVEKAAQYKAWAVEIRSRTVPPPPWLVEEWPDYQDEMLNQPKPPPKKERPSRRFACTIQYTPTPRPDAAPRRWSKECVPSSREILDLAIRLDDTRSIPRDWFSYPAWASYPRHRDSTMEYIALLKQRAEAILRGIAAPPRWLLSREPWRWIRQPRFVLKTRPAPATLDQAARHRLARNAPLGIASVLAILRLAIGKASTAAPIAWRAPPTCPPFTLPPTEYPALCTREILLWYAVGSVDGTAAWLPHVALTARMRHAVDRAQLFVIRKAEAA